MTKDIDSEKKPFWKPPISLAIGILGVILTLLAVDYYIEYKINKALQAEGIIKKFDDYINSKVNKAIQGDAVIKKFDDYIDSKIRNALQSEEIIKKLQSNNRPFMIFDQNEVVSDQGAGG